MMTTNNNAIFARTVETETAKRASASRMAERANRALVEERCPEAVKIESEIKETALEFASKIMESPEDAAAFRALADELIAKKKGELALALGNAGLSPDILEPVYFCSECRDTGFTKAGLCRCMRQAVINAEFSGSGVDPEQSFESFRFDLLTDAREQRAMRRIYDHCAAYADSFPNNDVRDMLLVGTPGVGKTFLLNCIAGRVLKNGHSVLKINANKMIIEIMDSFRDYSSAGPDFSMPELLVIDDLGAESMIPNVTVENLLSVLCERQDAKKATLIATNLDTEELTERYGSRVVSRLIAPRLVRIIPIETANVRLINK